MPSGLLTLFGLLIGLIYSDVSGAHMLNMTRVEVVATDAESAVVTINIDLGQSLMSAQEYWATTQAPEHTRRSLLSDSLGRLQRDMIVLLDGEPASLELLDASVSAISLEAIQNPLTPQMAKLKFRMPIQQAGLIQLKIDPALEVPWPLLFKVDLQGDHLPQSRLLTEVDRLSYPAAISPEFLPVSKDYQSVWLMNDWVDLMPWMIWIAVGFQHIIPRGLDHILFILGLFLVCQSWRSLLLQVTGFTLAHSLTLGLSTYGLISVPASVIEPLIALSIVYVALDSTLGPKFVRWRFAVVCLDYFTALVLPRC